MNAAVYGKDSRKLPTKAIALTERLAPVMPVSRECRPESLLFPLFPITTMDDHMISPQSLPDGDIIVR
jgi:hypothetical protein